MKPTTRRRARDRQEPSKQARSAVQSPKRLSRYYPYVFSSVLAAGIAIRILAFGYIGYFNNDNHLAVLEYVSRHWAPPNAGQFNQAYHPPLYYFLAAPFFRAGNLPAVQGLSLLLSIATLAAIALLFQRLPWISEQLKPWCLALAAFHPQFVLFSLFISNDTLAIFLGALIFYQCWRAQAVPSKLNFVLLGIFLGLGLLTKAVFLVFVLPLALFVCLTNRRLPDSYGQIFSQLAMVLGIATLVGCYKYVENFLLFDNPTISNLDFADWTATQRPTWSGVVTLFDVNVLKLLRDPTVSPATVHSYPLMLYGSFWYSFLPESTFQSNLVAPFNRLGSMIYLVALCPTTLMLIGALRIGRAAVEALLPPPNQQNPSNSARKIFEVTLLFTLLLNVLLVISVGWNYDVWSVFQGRLLFPSYLSLLIAFHAGMEWTESSPLKAKLTRGLLLALILLFVVYFLVEFWLASVHPANPLSMDHMPYKVDMNAR